MRLKWYWFTKSSNIVSEKPDIIPKLYISTSTFNPTQAKDWYENRNLENFLTSIDLDIQQAMKNKQKFKVNISKVARSHIQSLINNENIIIRPADKNLGPVIIDKVWYMNEMKRHTDSKDYRVLSNKQVSDIERDFYKKKRFILDSLSLPDYIENFLSFYNDFNRNIPTLNLLPKVHKLSEENLALPLTQLYPLLKGRLLVSCHSYITTNLSKFLSYILSHTVSKLPTVLENSYKLVSDLSKLKLRQPQPGEEIFITTFDVKELYPSMPGARQLQEYREIFNRHFVPHPDFPEITSNVFVDLLSLIFETAICTFDKIFYNQEKGAPMGTPVAAQLANFFMFALEIDLVRKQMEIALYCRFIDDGFMIFIGKKQNLLNFYDKFKQLHPDIDITFEISTTSIPYLDCVIYFGENFQETRILDTKVFQKPLNKYLYILPNSAHSNHIFKGFILGELIRYVRLSSNESSFREIKQLFFNRLICRGYSPSFLTKIFDLVTFDKERYQHSKKKQNSFGNNLVFKIRQSPRLEVLRIKQTLLKHWSFIERDVALSQIFPDYPILSLKSNKNLANYLCPTNPL